MNDDLKNKYNCHSVILYGSRARGDYTANSDYDVIGITKGCKKIHLGEYDENLNVYKDIFVVSEEEFDEIKEEYLFRRVTFSAGIMSRLRIAHPKGLGGRETFASEQALTSAIITAYSSLDGRY